MNVSKIVLRSNQLNIVLNSSGLRSIVVNNNRTSQRVIEHRFVVIKYQIGISNIVKKYYMSSQIIEHHTSRMVEYRIEDSEYRIEVFD